MCAEREPDPDDQRDDEQALEEIRQLFARYRQAARHGIVAERTEILDAQAAGAADEGGAMVFRAEDRVVTEAESTERRPRSGTVREVLREDPPRYRIEWDDGHESIYAPAAGALRAEQHSTGSAR